MAEPFFTEIPTSSQMTEVYNWYASERSWADSKKYILEYLQEKKEFEKAKKIKAAAEFEISWVCGWICRLISQGSKVDPASVVYLNNWLGSL